MGTFGQAHPSKKGLNLGLKTGYRQKMSEWTPKNPYCPLKT